MDKVCKDLKEKGDIVYFVNMKECLKIAAAGFSRDVFETEDVYGIALPIITKVEPFGFKGVYSPKTYEDSSKDLKTQKLCILVITEGCTFEIDVPGLGVYVFFYDGKEKGFAPKSSFNKKDFEDRSSKNIDANSIDRASRKAAEDLKRQSASVKPFIEELLVESPVTKIVDDYWKKEDGGTHNPFAVLSLAQSKTAAPHAVDNSKDKKSAKAKAKAEPVAATAG